MIRVTTSPAAGAGQAAVVGEHAWDVVASSIWVKSGTHDTAWIAGTAAYGGGVGGGGPAISAAGNSVSNGTVVFSNSNNVTFGMAGSTITASAAGGAGAGIGAIAAGTQTATSGTVVFSNSNNLSFTMNGSTQVVGSASFPAQTVQPAVNLAAGTQTATSGTVVFSASNNVSWTMNGSTQVVASASFPAQTTQPAIGSISVVGNTSGTTSAGSGTLVLAGGPNITLSGSTAAGAMTLSVSAGAGGGGGLTGKYYENVNGALELVGASQTRLFVQPIFIDRSMSITQAAVIGHMSGSSAAASGAITLSLALYTYNASTANTVSTATQQISWTSGSDTSASSRWGGNSGTRYRTMSLNGATWNITPGDYLLAFNMSTATSQTAHSWSFYGKTNISIVAAPGGGNETRGWRDGALATAGMPATIHLTALSYTGNNAIRQPFVQLLGTF